MMYETPFGNKEFATKYKEKKTTKITRKTHMEKKEEKATTTTEQTAKSSMFPRRPKKNHSHAA